MKDKDEPEARDPGAGTQFCVVRRAGRAPGSGVAEADQRRDRPAPVHRAPHPQRPGPRAASSTGRRPAATGWACACWNWATWSRRGWTCARRRSAPMRELHKLTHQPVNLSMRQGDEIVYIERTYSEHSGMQVVRAIGGRAPLHLTSVGKLFLADGRSAAGARLCHPHRPGRAHAQQHHRPAGAGTRTGQGAQDWHGARRRRAGAGRALHGGGHLRRPEQADRRPVDLGTGRPAGRRLDGASCKATAAQISAALGHRAD